MLGSGMWESELNEGCKDVMLRSWGQRSRDTQEKKSLKLMWVKCEELYVWRRKLRGISEVEVEGMERKDRMTITEEMRQGNGAVVVRSWMRVARRWGDRHGVKDHRVHKFRALKEPAISRHHKIFTVRRWTVQPTSVDSRTLQDGHNSW